ncbi:hypothetical protein UNDKW_5428 [Undibacterium sp. KW1]|uniref:DUF6622 family protein n=1 Tax=Undibacterium sp. KW1 TaxID=2058624 RepID=UPI001331E7B7|nr:DUF6622 family protein [Undibacterium sp. KW1]BBB63701.1 hypothetical protein UNDKW_5428 [Undibacterium sp. KW1]
MLNQIISGTPMYVWAILGFLAYRGIKSSVDRELTVRAVVIIPLVMLALSVQGILSGFGADPVVMAAWLATMTAGAAVSWNMVSDKNVRILADKGTVFYRGSWGPLVMMMSIFVMKYVVNVALHVNPALHSNMLFAVISTALFGLFNGLFLGKMLRVLIMYKQAMSSNAVFTRSATV